MRCRNAFVANFCVEALFIGGVAHVLNTTIRQQDVIFAAGHSIVTVLNVAEIVSSVEVTNSISESVSFLVLKEKIWGE